MHLVPALDTGGVSALGCALEGTKHTRMTFCRQVVESALALVPHGVHSDAFRVRVLERCTRRHLSAR